MLHPTQLMYELAQVFVNECCVGHLHFSTPPYVKHDYLYEPIKIKFLNIQHFVGDWEEHRFCNAY